MLTIDADGVQFGLQAHGVLVANSVYIAGGVPAAPQARLDDGVFDVALVPVQSALERLLTSLDLVRGRLVESDRVATFTARTLEVRAEPELTYTMDGEAAPNGPLRFRMLPAALSIVAAEHAPAFEPASK
jgi:diacylglycerol kinase family enzyme